MDFVCEYFSSLLYVFGMILVSVSVGHYWGSQAGIMLFGAAMVLLAIILKADYN